jgi:hypothetical protein
MLASWDSAGVWVFVAVSVACGGRSVRLGEDDDTTTGDGGAGAAERAGSGGSIAIGGMTSATESAGAGGVEVRGGAGGLGGGAGTSGLGGTAGSRDGHEMPSPHAEPCDPAHGPLEPTGPSPCLAPEPPPDDCDELAREYEIQVGLAQWCELDSDCYVGTPVPATLHCACDVIVRDVHDIAPIAAEWRAHGCVNEVPCSALCPSPAMPYRCGEAGFCLDDRH